jgi:hypothetical protein
MGGNVAFKVTYVYGNKGAFTSPCTPQGREINIDKLQKVWCGQSQCECNKAYRAGNTRIISATPAPCYDSVIFRDWAFAGGVWHNGPRKNQPIPLRQVIPGKYAFFTTRSAGMEESDRIVVGCYVIRDVVEEQDGYFVRAQGKGIQVGNYDHAPKYWNFHKQKGGPRWGTGLFRYLKDQEAQALLQAVEKASKIS